MTKKKKIAAYIITMTASISLSVALSLTFNLYENLPYIGLPLGIGAYFLAKWLCSDGKRI